MKEPQGTGTDTGAAPGSLSAHELHGKAAREGQVGSSQPQPAAHNVPVSLQQPRSY